MKNLFYLIIVGILFLIYGCNNSNLEQKIPDAIEEKADTVISVENIQSKDVTIEVYNFFGVKRGEIYNAIRENAKATLEESFKAEIESGKVKFVEINYDDEKNQDIVAKFEATGSGLYILSMIDGDEMIENLTEFAFMTALDESEVYKEAIRTNISDKLTN